LREETRSSSYGTPIAKLAQHSTNFKLRSYLFQQQNRVRSLSFTYRGTLLHTIEMFIPVAKKVYLDPI
jgi:hypothetical protein